MSNSLRYADPVQRHFPKGYQDRRQVKEVVGRGTYGATRRSEENEERGCGDRGQGD